MIEVWSPKTGHPGVLIFIGASVTMYNVMKKKTLTFLHKDLWPSKVYSIFLFKVLKDFLHVFLNSMWWKDTRLIWDSENNYHIISY